MARVIVIDCEKRDDGRFDVYEYPSTWTGFLRAAGVTRAEAWKVADRTIVCSGQRLSVRGLGRRRKGE